MSEPPLLDYEPPQPQMLLVVMRRWQHACFWCVVGLIGSLIVQQFFFAAVLGVAVLGTAVMTIVYLGMAARLHVNTGYAARHVVLAVLLLPLLLLGVWAVPGLIESDIEKWERREAARDEINRG